MDLFTTPNERSKPEGATTLFDSLLIGDTLNLNVGAPSNDLLHSARNIYHQATTMANSSASFFQYGPQLGHEGTLTRLADFLSNEYNSQVNPQDLMLTNGCSQAFFNSVALFSTPQTIIILHQPTYFLAAESLKDQPIDFEIVGSSSDLDVLNQFLTDRATFVKPERFPFIFYCNPTFANPSGQTMSLEFRQQLLKLAYKHKMLLICDDVYDMLSYSDDKLPPRIVSLDEGEGTVLSLGTLSKIFAPGSRMGWIEARRKLIDRFAKSGLLASGGASVQLLSLPLGGILPQLHSHLVNLRRVYSLRMHFMLRELEQQNLPITIIKPTGGFFIWIEHIDAVKFRAHALSRSKPVGFAPGAWFAPAKSIDPTAPSYTNYARLSFTFYNEPELKEGIERFASAFREFTG
jgi:2-aminoadipate transaminase